MHLTRFADLGLRVLMYLAPKEAASSVTVGELSERLQVPHNHLVKVVNRLAKLGRVQTVRGRGGGLRLSTVPADVKLGALLRELEESSELIDCDSPPCPWSGRCRLKQALDAGLHAFYAKLDEFTLADVGDARGAEALLTLHRLHVPEPIGDPPESSSIP